MAAPSAQWIARAAARNGRRARPLNSVVSQHQMPHQSSTVELDRPLSEKEVEFTRWLLEHGSEEARAFVAQLDHARVVSRCGCGCASVDFAISGQRGSPKQGMKVLSDYQWRDTAGQLFGAFVFACGKDLLGGIEVWSIDGRATPEALPNVERLEPYGAKDAG